MKRVIGVIGPLASGKDETSEYINSITHFPIYQISSVVKDMAKKEHTELTRDNLIQFGRELASKHGDDFLVKYLLPNIHDSSIMVGMRQIGQIHYLRKNTKLLLIGIDVDARIRFERMNLRGKPGDPSTLEEFTDIEYKDNESSVQNLNICMKEANYIIKNEGSLDELHEKINHILKREKIV